MNKMMIFIAVITIITTTRANAACQATTKTYTACKAGYYLTSGTCSRCPSSGGVYGITADRNTGGITSCYLPSGTTGSDAAGSFTYTSNCYYTN